MPILSSHLSFAALLGTSLCAATATTASATGTLPTSSRSAIALILCTTLLAASTLLTATLPRCEARSIGVEALSRRVMVLILVLLATATTSTGASSASTTDLRSSLALVLVLGLGLGLVLLLLLLLRLVLLTSSATTRHGDVASAARNVGLQGTSDGLW